MKLEEEEQILNELGIAIYETASVIGLASNHCIWAGNFAHKVLKCLDIPHKVRPVGTIVFNKEGWEQAGNSADKMSAGAWNVTASRFSPDLGGWSGHLVIETDNFFFDPNSSQFVREDRNILLPPFITIDRNELLSPRDTTAYPCEGFSFTTATDLWKKTLRSMFEQTELKSPDFDANRAYGSYRYFPLYHYDSKTLSMYSYFLDTTNLVYRDSPDWHKNWKQLGCGRVMTRIQERRREMNRAERHADEPNKFVRFPKSKTAKGDFTTFRYRDGDVAVYDL